ncbi:MAG: 1-phosphofructokinase family hexose kinase [Planctomycetes bacterium]|nr:1-phosphofructokinase family hexose kinase [Planctomycetota bacterium]
MIITVTLNPAIDQTIEVEEFHETDTNRVAAIRWDIGGKGINVARTLKELGYEPLACGFAPRDLGGMIEDALQDAGIGCEFVLVPGEMRTNITILDRSTHRHTVLAAAGAPVDEHAVELLRSRIARRVRPGSWVVLAGSIPPPGDAGLYTELIRVALAGGARVALDADGPVVAAVLDAGALPTLLKLNDHELERLLDRPVLTEAGALEGARMLRRRGVQDVVVTRGPDGAIASTAAGEFRVSAAPVEVNSAVGAGDAFLAGLLLGLVRDEGWVQALTLGAAAGSACCMTAGTLLCHAADVARLQGSIRVERIREASGVR